MPLKTRSKSKVGSGAQALVAELFQKDVRTVSEHLQNICKEGVPVPAATIRKFRMVHLEGALSAR